MRAGPENEKLIAGGDEGTAFQPQGSAGAEEWRQHVNGTRRMNSSSLLLETVAVGGGNLIRLLQHLQETECQPLC